MELSEAARHAQLDAIGNLLVDGELRIFDGPRGNNISNPIVKFAVASVSKAKAGKVEVSIEEACIANREGTASWYCWCDKGGRLVATGEVGKEFEVTPSYFVQGTRAMVDKIVIEID